MNIKKFHFVIILMSASLATAETIVLSNGSTLNAPILIQREGAVAVDLGFTVLNIPKEKIISMQNPADPNSMTVIDPILEETIDGLYHTADLKPIPLQQSYRTVSPAVLKVSTPVGLGSGFMINEKGFLITNYHVVEQETRITVTLFEEGNSGFERKIFKKVRIVAINPFLDLALLKVEDEPDAVFPFVYLGKSSEVRVGQNCFAVGNPLGLERSLSEGAITTVSRAFAGLVYIQTNADINPGNSGGPLFNMAGEVIGVTNMGAVFFGGLGFAIPVDAVRDFLDHYQAFAYDKDNPNSGYRYLQPDSRQNSSTPDWSKLDK